MAKNDPEHPEEARIAQDVDVPGIILSEGAYHTGRGNHTPRVVPAFLLTIAGGAANTYVPTEEERLEAKENNERLRRESFRRSSRDHGVIKGLAEKAKETLTGKHGQEK